jgi:hypothetical protein
MKKSNAALNNKQGENINATKYITKLAGPVA